jgi:protoporphyrinogen oxidase
MSDAALGELVKRDLVTAGVPISCDLVEVVTRRLPAAYPIYHTGYEVHFACVDEHLAGINGLISFGRQGLFAHDNTHHALFMANSAVACLNDEGVFDAEAWAEYRTVFETHVVED